MGDGQPERRKTGKHRASVSLKRFDPSDKPFSTGEKNQDKALVESLALELDELQNLFYADRRYKLLVILQGTDTSGRKFISMTRMPPPSQTSQRPPLTLKEKRPGW